VLDSISLQLQDFDSLFMDQFASKHLHTRIALFLIWVLPVLWAVNLIIARRAPGIATPHVLALGRWGLAGVLLGWSVRQEFWEKRKLLCSNYWRFLALGACGMWICGAWVYLAGQSTGALNISLIYASSPVFIALGSVFLLRETFSHWQKLGVCLALAGVLHVVVQGEWMNLAQIHLVPGDLWVLAASIAWAAYALLQKRWFMPLSAKAFLAATCMGGSLVLLPFAVWELLQPSTPPFSLEAMWLMLVAALIPGAAAYWIYGWTQSILGVARVAVTLYLGPLYAAVVAWFLLGESLGWHHALGGVLILSGVGMVVSSNR
jgi:drug/metabolite transporter (DMT)-like permease